VAGHDRGDPGRRADSSTWHWLLAVPAVVPLAVPLYNRLEPALFGLPFFYWCQLAFVALAGGVTAAVHLLTRRGR
jgi:putative effector of murein hydrolase